MEKNSRRHSSREGMDRIGCVRVFISMFDFRHVGSAQKLLAYKKRGSKRIAGNGNLANKIDKSSCSSEDPPGILDCEDGLVEPETGRRSFKKHVEEETFTNRDIKGDEKMQKICDSGCEGSKGKNRKRKSKSHSKSHETIDSLVVTDQVVETEDHQVSDHQTASVLQELKWDETNGDYAKKFTELIKRLVAEKSNEIQSCKELLKAFQVLGSGEESFMKGSHERGVPLLEDDQSLGSSWRMVEENPRTIERSGVSEENVRAEAQSDVVAKCKKRKFFSRKAKSREKSSVVQSDSSQVPKTIVVLKPGPKFLDVGSSSEPYSTCNKAKNGSTGSQFLISGIKRRLKSAIRKEPRVVLKDNIPQVLSDMSQNSEQEEPFSYEKTPGASVSEVDREENKAIENSKNNVSRIYAEAKKHLSEMLANGEIDVNVSSKEVPRILGRILSLPELSPTEGSPRRTRGHDFINADKNEPEHVPSTLCRMSEEPKIQQFSSGDYFAPPELESKDLANEDTVKLDEILTGSRVQIPQGVSDTVNETEFTDDEDLAVLDPLSGQCGSSNLGMHDEEGDKQLVEQFRETFNESQTPTSPLGSPPNSSARMIECKDSASDVPGKSSPVSVLDPPFTEDDISPRGTTSRIVGIRMQPLCIKFDEPDASLTDKDNVVMDDKESALAYIKAVVKSLGLNWDELYLKSVHSARLLVQPLKDDTHFHSNQLCNDENLLLDCINEVLLELCGHEFRSGPWISSVKPTFRLISDIENVVKEAQEGVYYHLLPLPFPHTLDQIVAKDMARTDNWMDLQFDIDCIGTDTGELILEELLEEIVETA